MTNNFMSFDVPGSHLAMIEAKLNEIKYSKSVGTYTVGSPSEGHYQIIHQHKPASFGTTLVREEDVLWSIKIHLKSGDSQSEMYKLLLHHS